jgi:phasin family protein
MTAFEPSFDKITEYHKANYDALMKSHAALVAGFEQISKEVVTLTQASLESAAAATKAALAVKTLADLMSLQADYGKTSFEKLVADSTKLGELGVKVANEAIAPVSARVNETVAFVRKAA